MYRVERWGEQSITMDLNFKTQNIFKPTVHLCVRHFYLH